jgi:hypothetical protein
MPTRERASGTILWTGRGSDRCDEAAQLENIRLPPDHTVGATLRRHDDAQHGAERRAIVPPLWIVRWWAVDARPDLPEPNIAAETWMAGLFVSMVHSYTSQRRPCELAQGRGCRRGRVASESLYNCGCRTILPNSVADGETGAMDIAPEAFAWLNEFEGARPACRLRSDHPARGFGWWQIGEGQTAPIMPNDMDPLLRSFVHFF